jgi:hypothetical protein
MIESLKGPKHFDLRLYAIGKLAHEIESAFCAHFGTERVYYYFESCQTHRTLVDSAPTRLKPHNKEVCACHHHRLVWCGAGILRFIHTLQKYSRKYHDAPTLFVTDLDHKGGIEHLRTEYDRLWKLEDIAYTAMANYAIYETSKLYRNEYYQRLYAEKQRLYNLCDVAEKELNKHEYWIGDASSDGHMICCDTLFYHLWNELRKK